MQAKHKGIISQFASLLFSFASWMRKTPFRQGLDAIAVSAVRGYQRYLSPRKGFSCAHRRLHGGTSCSEYFRQSIEAKGLGRAISLFQQRLEACKQANFLLKIQSMGEINAEVDEEKEQRKQPDRNCNDTACNSYDCSCLDGLGNCDLNPDVNCDTPDCGSFDCGGCDCSW